MSSLVVAGVDGSSASEAAVVQAAREADRRRARLRLVHAFSWPAGNMYAPLDTAPLTRMAQDAAQHALSVAPGVDVSHAVMIGDPVSVLAAESRSADLLVVGRRGVGGFIGKLLGSTAVSLAAQCECPVVVVREEQDGTGPVVVAVDGSARGEKAVDFAFEEAELRGADLVVVHAWDPDAAPAGTDEATAEHVLATAIGVRPERHPAVTVKQQVATGEVREALIEASRNAQLMVVGARGHGGFAGMLLGSVSQALLHHTHCPIAVVRGTD